MHKFYSIINMIQIYYRYVRQYEVPELMIIYRLFKKVRFFEMYLSYLSKFHFDIILNLVYIAGVVYCEKTLIKIVLFSSASFSLKSIVPKKSFYQL